MSNEPSTSNASEQRAVWDQKAADVWERRIEPQRAPLFEAVIRALALSPEAAFLDAGCGGGGVALAAYRAGAKVSGCDKSEGVLAAARAKVPSGEFRVADLAALPYAANSFDVVVACDCLLSSRDAPKAIDELGRVCRPGGSLCIVIWERPARSAFSRVMEAMQSQLPTKPLITPLALSGDGVLDALLEQARLRIRKDETIRLDYRFANFDDFWGVVRLLGGIKLMNDAVGEERIQTAALDAARDSIRPNNELVMNHAFRLVIAEVKPS